MYWIKIFKNGEFLNKLVEMNFFVDGIFDLGLGVDGIIFIIFICELINCFFDLDMEDDEEVLFYKLGDDIWVEIYLFNNDVFCFLQVVQE